MSNARRLANLLAPTTGNFTSNGIESTKCKQSMFLDFIYSTYFSVISAVVYFILSSIFLKTPLIAPIPAPTSKTDL